MMRPRSNILIVLLAVCGCAPDHTLPDSTSSQPSPGGAANSPSQLLSTLRSPRLYSDKEVEGFRKRLDALPERPETLDAFVKALGIDRKRLRYRMVRTGNATEWTDYLISKSYSVTVASRLTGDPLNPLPGGVRFTRRLDATADALTIEMFKPYLTKQHSVNDVMRAFPEPYFFNAGGAFIWATYKLSDGTILTVGEHGAASALLKNAEGQVVQRFPFGSEAETRFPVIGSAGSPVDISPARLPRAKAPPEITPASLFENWDGTLVTREGTARTDLRPKAGVLFHRYPYMTVGGHFRPTGTFVCYAPDKGVFFLLGDCVMDHAERLWGPYAGDPRKVLLDAVRDNKQDAPADADKPRR